MFDELEGPCELNSMLGKGFFLGGGRRKRREYVVTGGQGCGVEAGSLVQKHPSTLGLDILRTGAGEAGVRCSWAELLDEGCRREVWGELREVPVCLSQLPHSPTDGGDYQQQGFVSHGSGGWKCEILESPWSGSGEGLLIGSEGRQTVRERSKVSFRRTLIPLLRAPV